MTYIIYTTHYEISHTHTPRNREAPPVYFGTLGTQASFCPVYASSFHIGYESISCYHFPIYVFSPTMNHHNHFT